MEKSFFRQLLHFLIRGDKEQERIHRDFSRLLKSVAKANNLLDVGCAEGDKTVRYAENLKVPGENIYGIEIFDKYIDIAKNRLHVIKLNLERDTFPFHDEAFEVITCNQIFEHLKNIFLSLSEMERTLKNGGYLAIGIPNLAGLHNRILLVLGFQPVCNAIIGPHIRCFTHKAFIKFLKSNSNFRLIAVAGSSLYPFPYPIVEFGAYLFPGLSAYTFYLLKKIKHNLQESSWRISSIGDTCL